MTFGPLTRISSLSSTGASLISTPGTGTPITPARSIGKCAAVASGDVSVRPHEEVIITGSPCAASDDRLQPRPEILRQRGGGVEDQVQALEEARAQVARRAPGTAAARRSPRAR